MEEHVSKRIRQLGWFDEETREEEEKAGMK